MMLRLLNSLTLLTVLLGGMAGAAWGQQRYSDVGVGFQGGVPTGVTVRLYDRTPPVGEFYDFVAAWDLHDSLYLVAHGLRERRIRSSLLNYYHGPGALVGFDQRNENTEIVLGVSYTAGLNYFVERFEIFMQLTPRFILLRRTALGLGGGVGLRYYL